MAQSKALGAAHFVRMKQPCPLGRGRSLGRFGGRAERALQNVLVLTRMALTITKKLFNQETSLSKKF